jgi:riboflavin kinase / FMN adenylyltransferase
MQVIHIKHPHLYQKSDFPEMVIALGYFDGVHLGHQQVITKAKTIAEKNDWKSAVMTFNPHPSVVLGRNVDKAEYITPLQDKVQRIEELGIDYLFVVEFTHEFANLFPQEFIDQYIIQLNIVHVVAGFDFSYGRMGKGNMETLPFHSRSQFDYTVVPKFSNGDKKVSSTLIREAIKNGEMEKIPPLLGGFYTTSGTVIHGDKRGRTIGFPTANVSGSGEYILPPLGVYSVRIKVGDSWYEGVANLGVKPTFNQDGIATIEVHIFDFAADIYGSTIVIEWHLRLRAEQKFSGIQQLVTQIEKDKQKAVEYFQS